MQRSQKCRWLPRLHHSCVSRMSQPLSPAHGTTQPPTPTRRRRFLPTKPRALLTTRRRSYTFSAATLPNPTPKLTSRATRASLLMHCKGRTQGCRILSPGTAGTGSPPRLGVPLPCCLQKAACGDTPFTQLGKAAEPNLYILKRDAEIKPYTRKKKILYK